MSQVLVYRGILSAIVLAFIFGAYLLESAGIRYVSDGGLPLFKIHLYSYLVLAVFIFCYARIGVSNLLDNLHHLRSYWWISFVSVALVIVYGLIKSGVSGLAYLVDTILIPILIVPLVAVLKSELRMKLLGFLSLMLIINSIIALFEFLFQKSLIFTEFQNFSYFRSPAFLAHPLNNALITATLTPLLFSATRIPAIVYISLVLLALFSFGGRGALGVFIVSSVFLLLPSIKKFIVEGLYISKKKFALYHSLLLVSFLLVVMVLVFTSVGDRILNKLFIDDSAQVRMDVFILLYELTFREWLFGADASLINNVEQYIRAKTVENYVIGWILQFGALASIALLVAVMLIPLRLALAGNLFDRAALLSFIIISLTNNALTTKTPALLFLFMALTCRHSGNLFLASNSGSGARKERAGRGSY